MFWRARDSLYFEPLVALAIIVVILVGLYAYTSNWPPVYVVESNSMQHGPNDVLGLINTGDLVLAQKVSNATITPYLVGMLRGYSTYGEYGDVLLYHPSGQGGATPIIHRAILFLNYDPVNRTYSAPALGALQCGSGPGAVWQLQGGSCRTTGMTGTLDLYGIGWRSMNLSISITPAVLGAHSGYLTLGDANSETDQTAGLSTLVEPGWVIGVARGMIPWFGALKLLLTGNSQMVPSQSWQFMGLTIAGAILLAFGIHYALRAEGIETPLRKEEDEERRKEREERESREAEEEDEEEEAVDEEPDSSRSHRWVLALRPWHRDEQEAGTASVTPRPRERSRSARSRRPDVPRRGRPRPRVRRTGKTGHRGPDQDL